MTTDEIFYQYQSADLIRSITPYENLSVMWEETVKKYSPLPAVEHCGRTYSYAKLNEDAACFRTLLLRHGLKCGDTVCLLAGRSYDFIKAFLAAATLGITVAVLPLHFVKETINKYYAEFASRLMLFSDDTGDLISQCSNIRSKINIRDTSDMPTEAFCAYPASAPCLIMFTGGTSGKNKGAILSHQCVMQGIMNGCYGYNAVYRQRYLLVLPLFHVFGLIRSVLTPLYTGSEIFINTVARNLFQDIAAFKPTIAVLVPLLVERGLALSRAAGKNLFGDDMKYIITGAAPLAPYIAEECSKLGITLCMGYGLTETACLVSGNPDMLGKPGSVGPLYPHQEYRLVEDELWLKGANLLTAYTDAEENEQAFEAGWFKTGDAVRFDEDGFMYIIGRKKEMLLKSNGENVYPTMVEEKFNALYDVQASMLSCVTIDNKEQFVLEVFPRIDPHEENTENFKAQLMAKLETVNAGLPKFQQADKIIIREKDFERTASLKLIREIKK